MHIRLYDFLECHKILFQNQCMYVCMYVLFNCTLITKMKIIKKLQKPIQNEKHKKQKQNMTHTHTHTHTQPPNTAEGRHK